MEQSDEGARRRPGARTQVCEEGADAVCLQGPPETLPDWKPTAASGAPGGGSGVRAASRCGPAVSTRAGNEDVLRLGEPGYPRPLRHTFDPPPRLYVLGGGDRERAFSGVAVAIVGARDATAEGEALARALGRGLAESGVTVVSGLAIGIDGAAHRGALEAGGLTVAVVGAGTDVVYPHRHRALREAVVQRGLVVGEWPSGTRPRPFHFPRRNRIISGLSLGVVVVEASVRSGALSTARWALEQGREVFAVPGPAGAPRSAGPHRLLRAGARLVEGVQDILDELPFEAPVGARSHDAGTPRGNSDLLAAIGRGAVTVDALVARTGRRPEDVWVSLLDLEVRGAVARSAGGRFVRCAQGGAPAS